MRQSLKDLARAVSERQPVEQSRKALQESLSRLTEFRAALVLGRLVVCGNCAHFQTAREPTCLGSCQRFQVEAWALVPFSCSGFKISAHPQAPEFLPDPDGARTRRQEYAK
jgi:hypothetical protein